MQYIDKSLFSFATAVESSDCSVVVDREGYWYCQNFVMRFAYWLFGWEDARLEAIGKFAINLLDSFEREPLVVTEGSEKERQTQKRRAVLKVAMAAFGSLSKQGSSSLNTTIMDLKYRAAALRKRYNLFRKENSVFEEAQFQEFIKAAAIWKKNHPLAVKGQEELHPYERANFEKLRDYPGFMMRAVEDPSLRFQLFKWAILDCLPIRIMAEYPAVTQRIHRCLLKGPFARFAYQQPLRVEEVDGKLTVTAPFYHQRVSILNEQQIVELRGGYRVKIAEIFEDFANKNQGHGSFAFTNGNEGFCSWDGHLMAWRDGSGSLHQVDLSKNAYWQDLPCIEILDREIVKRRYLFRDEDLQEGMWAYIPMASRQSNEMRVDDCHGYRTILEPREDGTYRLYSFGKFAKNPPRGSCEFVSMVGNTVLADIVAGDPNEYYSGFRQQVVASGSLQPGHPRAFMMTDKRAREFMNIRLKEEIIAGRDGRLVFMMPWENCAFPVQDDLEWIFGSGNVPNLYRSHVLKTGGSGPLDYLFRVIKELPECTHEFFVGLSSLLLGTWRGVEVPQKEGGGLFVCADKSPFRKGCVLDGKRVYYHINQPSLLHEKVAAGDIKGFIWFGHAHYQIMGQRGRQRRAQSHSTQTELCAVAAG